MPYRTRTYKRDELYQQVWSEPMVKVATRYGVSSVALAKMCRQLTVPVPNRGYWQKLAAGQAPERTPLPKLPAYGRSDVEVTRWENEHGEPATLPRTAQDRIDAERDPASKIYVRGSLDKAHVAVQQTAAKLRRAKADGDGFVRSANETLDVKVAPTTVDRALRILDALAQAFAVRDLTVEIARRAESGGQRNSRVGTCVRVMDEWLVWRLYERYSLKERQKKPASSEPSWLYTKTCKVPNGKLVLEVTNRTDLGHELSVRTQWVDDKRRLEDQLNDFVVGLYVIAEELKRDRAAIADRRRAEADREKERWIAQQEAARQQKREQDLRDTVGYWRLANDIRGYVADMRAAMSEGAINADGDSPLEQHIAFALEYADRIDPLRTVRRTG